MTAPSLVSATIYFTDWNSVAPLGCRPGGNRLGARANSIPFVFKCKNWTECVNLVIVRPIDKVSVIRIHVDPAHICIQVLGSHYFFMAKILRRFAKITFIGFGRGPDLDFFIFVCIYFKRPESPCTCHRMT